MVKPSPVTDLQWKSPPVIGGLLTGSQSVLSVGFDNIGDVASSYFAWRFSEEALKPPDSEHHYGTPKT